MTYHSNRYNIDSLTYGYIRNTCKQMKKKVSNLSLTIKINRRENFFPLFLSPASGFQGS